MSDKREFDAEIVLKDQRSDLAVLRIKGANERFPTLEFANSDELQVGDVVLAIGDPFGVGQTVTHGIVSAVARTQVGNSDYQFFIQTDAAINPGNSGGALVDVNGRLVGINSAIYSRSGGSQRHRFCDSGEHGARRGRLGGERRQARSSAPGSAPSFRRSRRRSPTASACRRPSGALVASVVAGSPAARAGIKTGDLIVTIDGVTVDDPNAVRLSLCHQAAGRRGQIGLIAAGQRNSRPGDAAGSARYTARRGEIKGRSPFLGATVANLSPALADELRLDPQSRGRRHHRGRRRFGGTIGRFQEGRYRASRSTVRRSPNRVDLDRVANAGGRSWRVTIDARRPADIRDVQRMSSRPRKNAPTLFAAGGLDRDAPRPLADKLRPDKLADVVGQDHLLGARWCAHAHAGDAVARFADLLGPARHRQDNGGAAAGAGNRTLFRADFGDLFRRRRPEKSLRCSAAAPRDRAGDAAVRR